MSSNERRDSKRLDVRVPIRFRPVVNPPASELRTESINVSSRGVYFATDYPLRVGSRVEIHMQMPREVTGQPTKDLHCTGRVVHVEPDTFLGGMAGVGVHIERFEAAAGANWGEHGCTQPPDITELKSKTFGAS